MRYDYGARRERDRYALALSQESDQKDAPIFVEPEPTLYEQLSAKQLYDLYDSEDGLLNKASEIVLSRGFERLAEAIYQQEFPFPDAVVMLDTSARPLVAGVKPILDSVANVSEDQLPRPDYSFLVLFRDRYLIEYAKMRKLHQLDIWRESVRKKVFSDAEGEGDPYPTPEQVLTQQVLYVRTWEAGLGRLRSLILAAAHRTKKEPVHLLFVDDYVSQGRTINAVSLMLDELEKDPLFPIVDRSFFAFFAATQEGQTSRELNVKRSDEFGGRFLHGSDPVIDFLLTDFSSFPYASNGGFVLSAAAKNEREQEKSRCVGVRKIYGEPLVHRAKNASLSVRESLNRQIRALAEPFIFS